MYKESQNTTDAIIELIRTLPKAEQAKIAQKLVSKKTQKPVSELTDKEYAKRIKSFLAFAEKNKIFPKDFKFDREEAHKR